ncbi:multicopper oxidase [Patellaria atrata CBS 101060]|uniref:Multicopper oxidase n=1 Tax=Patellaria atrata CBS 101060 TaxID=1346257 RepID=A0A9P4S7M0_9PEZI|nr:multicopper oxidase [Patellaria atrata CBS 101060]
MPGPLIEANWGDTVKVTVINELENNETFIHFHGIRQNYTNQHDGVPSITQCPIAPNESQTYTWVASQYGSSWYLTTSLFKHGKDYGMVFLQDWDHDTVDSILIARILGGNITDAVGEHTVFDYVPGKRYLLRVINVAIQSTFKFFIGGHKFKVISTDFSPIVPYDGEILNVNIGQRYNLIIEADQPINNYWMRSDNQNVCANITQALDTKAIVHYEGAPTGPLTTSGNTYTGACVDEPMASLVPILQLNVGSEIDLEINKNITIAPNGDNPNLFRWYLSGTIFKSQWGDPTLYNIVANGTVPDDSGDLLIEISNEGEWVYMIGLGEYTSGTPLNLVNRPRRDTALMDGLGYLVIAFITDNPGVWLMHCHVGWHTSMGLALQIVEAMDQIPQTVDDPEIISDTCRAWDEYASNRGLIVPDSGV